MTHSTKPLLLTPNRKDKILYKINHGYSIWGSPDKLWFAHENTHKYVRIYQFSFWRRKILWNYEINRHILKMCFIMSTSLAEFAKSSMNSVKTTSKLDMLRFWTTFLRRITCTLLCSNCLIALYGQLQSCVWTWCRIRNCAFLCLNNCSNPRNMSMVKHCDLINTSPVSNRCNSHPPQYQQRALPYEQHQLENASHSDHQSSSDTCPSYPVYIPS